MRSRFIGYSVLITVVFFSVALAQTQMPEPSQTTSARKFALASGPQLSVVGGGSVGKLTKWTGFTSGNSIIGDSNIFEDKSGKVGIGTNSPTSLLTVQGMIEVTMGGLKFPDGSLQTTAAVSGLQSVFHNSTLIGNGTSGSPLGVAVPLNLTGNGIVLQVHAISSFGDGIHSIGGDSDLGPIAGGVGLFAQGGKCIDTILGCDGGNGILALGGDSASGFGGAGIRAFGGSGDTVGSDGLAGSFEGGVLITGELSVGGDLFVSGTKDFKIDHPLDPENKYLLHAAIESSEVLNIYSGNIKTDQNGDATVTLPDWFGAINRDFRYQLTVVGAFAQAIVASEINDNRFTIKTSVPNVKVSWQVTGIRSDPVMIKHPFNAEADKSTRERGFYLSPDAYGQTAERSIQWARDPEIMRAMRERREQARQKAHSNN